MKKKYLQKGVTLIELIVASGIFILIIFVIFGIFINVLKSQIKNLAFQEIQNNGRYILEMMVKEIRMSKVITDLGEHDSLEIIRNSDNKEVIYSLNNFQLFRELEDEQLPISSEEVKVNHLKFYVSSLLPLYVDTYYHRITIVMELESQRDPESKINLQTTVSPRPSPCPKGICEGF